MRKTIAIIMSLFIISSSIIPAFKVSALSEISLPSNIQSEVQDTNIIFKDEQNTLRIKLVYSDVHDEVLDGVGLENVAEMNRFRISDLNYGILNEKYENHPSDFEVMGYSPSTGDLFENIEWDYGVLFNIESPIPGIYKTKFSFYDESSKESVTEFVYLEISDTFAPEIRISANEVEVAKGSVLYVENLIDELNLSIYDNRVSVFDYEHLFDLSGIVVDNHFNQSGTFEVKIPSDEWLEEFYATYPYEGEIASEVIKIHVTETTGLEATEDSDLTVDNIEEPVEEPFLKDVQLSYRSHVQNIGWQDYVTNGIISGTTESNLRLEAFEISISGNVDLGVKYSSLLEDEGWGEYVSEGNLSGTIGEAKSLEAISIELTGNDKDLFDIYYRTYISGSGWLDWAMNGNKAGTEGYGYQMEAVEIMILEKGEFFPFSTEKPFMKYEEVYEVRYNLFEKNWSEEQTSGSEGDRNYIIEDGIGALKFSMNSIYDLGIMYTSHVQYIGWQNYVQDGEVSGTLSQGYKIEAVKLELTGSDKEKFDIFYRVKSDQFGWMEWGKNGNAAGSEGFGYAVKDIEIIIEPKDSIQLAEENAFFSISGNNLLSYNSHVQNIGWQDNVSDGELSGTIDQGRRLEGIRINLNPSLPSGSIHYSTHVQDYGWTPQAKDGEVSGTVGLEKRVEGIRMNLSGTVSDIYDLYYRVKLTDFNWLGWAKNGESAGSEGLSLQIESIEIRMVIKGEGDFEENLVPFIQKNGDPMIYYRSASNGGKMDNYTQESTVSGSIGKSLGLTNMGIYITEISEPSLKFYVHKSNEGWIEGNIRNGIASDNGNNIEAFKVELTGSVSEKFDVIYRAHVQNHGWLDWSKNGFGTGSMNMGLRLEAFEIRLVPKGTSDIVLNERLLISSASLPGYEFRTHIQNIGWQTEKNSSEFIGTIGKSLRMEAIEVNLAGHLPSGSIDVKAFVQGKGWVTEERSESFVGSVGEGRRIEEFMISLSGSISEDYDVYYRTHVSYLGWTGWAKNGEKAGSALYQYQIEAVEIRLIGKNEVPPYSNTDAFQIKLPEKLKTLYMERNDCFVINRKISPQGIVLHSTATPGVMAWEWYNRWNKSYEAGETNRQVAVHSFVDNKEMWQYLPWNHRGWHAGGTANNTHIGIEMCEPGEFRYVGSSMIGYDVVYNTAYFKGVWNNAAQLSVILSRMYNFDENDIISHAEGYKLGVASNHSDVSHWFPHHGESMDSFRSEVKRALDL